MTHALLAALGLVAVTAVAFAKLSFRMGLLRCSARLSRPLAPPCVKPCRA